MYLLYDQLGIMSYSSDWLEIISLSSDWQGNMSISSDWLENVYRYPDWLKHFPSLYSYWLIAGIECGDPPGWSNVPRNQEQKLNYLILH